MDSALRHQLRAQQLRAQQFRLYSRTVKNAMHLSHLHKKRIGIALSFEQSEPVQGALADYFYACWHEDTGAMLKRCTQKLPYHIYKSFLGYVGTGFYLPQVSELATRYSVLVSPSMSVPIHQRYVGKDDAKFLSVQISDSLLKARADGDHALIMQLQDEYLQHCLACYDRTGLLRTWFRLSRAHWQFDEAWQQTKAQLDLQHIEMQSNLRY